MSNHTDMDNIPSPRDDREKLTIEVKKVIFRNPDNGWTVIAAINDGDTITVCGVMPAVGEHELLVVSGEWLEHARYGRQFCVVTVRAATPHTVEGIEKYLSSNFSGIGQSTAKRITAHFGKETLQMLSNAPQQLLKVKGVSRKVLYNLIATWQEHREQAEILTALGGYQISPHLAQKIYRKYGDQALQTVERDPYQLPFTIEGLGFLSADKIGMALGIAPTSELRMRAAINYCLQKSEERGHCFLTDGQLLQQMERNLKIPQADFHAAFLAARQHAEKENFIVCERIGKQIAHYRFPIYSKEVTVATRLSEMLTAPAQTHIAPRELSQQLAARRAELSDEQLQAVRNFFQRRISVLTGASGTGKTSTVRLIVTLAQELDLRFVLCAPTGRAACRLEELTGQEAKTIHRLLEWQPQHGSFSRNASNRLDEELIVVDEVSMLDITLAEAILAGCNASAHLLLVGDVNQLPAVGAGNFLHDILQCDTLPAVRLRRIFRQGQTSQIIHNAHLVIQGKQQGYISGRDFTFVEEQDNTRIMARIKDYLRELPNAQVLAPVYNGNLGIDHLNKEIRSWLHSTDSSELKVGDKVIQTANNYTLNVYNGDIGYVCGVGKDDITVDFNGKLVLYARKHLVELKFAYAISIHKAQGSEFDAVIMPMIRAYTHMLNRNLIYTAITRAKKRMIIVGAAEVFKRGAQRNYENFRQTLLAQRLHQLLAH